MGKVLSILFVFALLSHLARAADGILDPQFGTNGVSTFATLPGNGETSPSAIAIQPDGKIVSAGWKSIGGNPPMQNIVVTRLLSTGILDDSFGGDGIVTVQIGVSCSSSSLVLQQDGKIVIAGGTNPTSGGASDSVVLRLNSDGTFDNAFGIAGIKVVSMTTSFDSLATVSVQTDGRIIAAGNAATQPGITPNFGIIRLLPNGDLDSTFDGDGIKIHAIATLGSGIIDLIVHPDGRFTVAGSVRNSLNYDLVVARYLFSGLPDTTFSSDGIATIQFGSGDDRASDLVLLPNDQIIVSGYFQNSEGRLESGLAKLSSNGTLDNTFGSMGKVAFNFGVDSSSVTTSLVSQKNGKLIVAGYLAGTGIGPYLTLAKFNNSGAIDNTFGTDGKVVLTVADYGRDVAIQPDGKVVVSGSVGSNFLFARFLNSKGVPTDFDFDGDGKTDLSMFRPNGAASELWWLNSSTGGNGAVAFGASTDTLVPSDYTADGKTDVAFWRPATGQWFVLRSEDFTFFAFPFGANGDVPVPGDFDGDGMADAAVFRPTTLTWYISKSSGGTEIVGFGASGDKPVVSDYDGDGKADIAVFRPNGANGAEWWIRRSSNGSVFATQFGSSTDKAVPADYTGDGKSDIAFWTPSSGNWFVLRSEDYSYFGFPFGSSTDIPSPGDYDGDGKTDAAVFRPSNSTWYAQRSTAGILIQQFGAPGDVPVPSAYVR